VSLLEVLNINKIQQSVQTYLGSDSFRLVLMNTGSNHSSDYRNLLRSKLKAVMAELVESNDEFHALEDLSRPPRHSEYSISISHGRLLSGFSLVKKPFLIGFDLEQTGRVSQAVFQRIASNQDSQPPSATHFWTAKEAVYKHDFRLNQSKTLTEFFISDWREQACGDFLFSAGMVDSRQYLNGYGCSISTPEHIFSFFLTNSQLHQ